MCKAQNLCPLLSRFYLWGMTQLTLWVEDLQDQSLIKTWSHHRPQWRTLRHPQDQGKHWTFPRLSCNITGYLYHFRLFGKAWSKTLRSGAETWSEICSLDILMCFCNLDLPEPTTAEFLSGASSAWTSTKGLHAVLWPLTIFFPHNMEDISCARLDILTGCAMNGRYTNTCDFFVHRFANICLQS